MCAGIGWVLDIKPSVELLGLELLPCLLPDCQWSGRAIAALSVTDASAMWCVIRRMTG
jgi:hypothetical protein